MKLTLSYTPEEIQAAAELDKQLLAQYPGAKKKLSCKHPPNQHVYYYISTNKPNPKRLGNSAIVTLDETAKQ